jgi:hypothetical protein
VTELGSVKLVPVMPLPSRSSFLVRLAIAARRGGFVSLGLVSTRELDEPTRPAHFSQGVLPWDGVSLGCAPYIRAGPLDGRI